jgi:hypothetical protein
LTCFIISAFGASYDEMKVKDEELLAENIWPHPKRFRNSYVSISEG